MTETLNPKLDLVLERTVDVAPSLVWTAWTVPSHLKKWFTPAPWSTVDCEIDLKPGGIFRTVMRSPEGQDFPNLGCFLTVVPERLLVWTNALGPGFRPQPAVGSVDFAFTARIELAPAGTGTRYTATVLHADAATRDKHDAMGFHDGWGTVLEQLVAFTKTL